MTRTRGRQGPRHCTNQRTSGEPIWGNHQWQEVSALSEVSLRQEMHDNIGIAAPVLQSGKLAFGPEDLSEFKGEGIPQRRGGKTPEGGGDPRGDGRDHRWGWAGAQSALAACKENETGESILHNPRPYLVLAGALVFVATTLFGRVGQTQAQDLPFRASHQALTQYAPRMMFEGQEGKLAFATMNGAGMSGPAARAATPPPAPQVEKIRVNGVRRNFIATQISSPPKGLAIHFTALSLLAVTLAAAAAYRWRMQQLESRRRQLEREVADRTAALLARQDDLAKSEERFKIMFEYAPDACFLCDFTGTFIAANRSAEEMFGLPRDEIIGKRYSELNLLSPAQLAKATAILEKLTRGIAVGREESVLSRRDGSHLPVEFTHHVVAIQQEKYLLGVVRDLTLRRQAEESKREQELLRGILDSSPIPMAIVRLRDSAVLFVNDRLLAAFGTSRESTIGVLIAESHVSPAAWEALRAELVAAGSIPHCELEVTRREGSTSWILASLQLISFHGEPAALTGFMDITERRELEKALRESVGRFRSVFEHALTGMACVSLEGRFLQVNPALCRMLGYSEAELLATTFAAVTHPEDVPSNLALLQGALAADQPSYHMEKRYVHREGHCVCALLNVVVVRDAEGRPSYLLSHVQDLTAHKLAEREIQQLNQELEQRVITRTQELKESEKKFRAIVDHAAEAIFIKDVAGYYQFINPAGAAFFGRRSEEMIGKQDTDLFEADDARDIKLIDERIMATGKAHTYEGRRRYGAHYRHFLTTKVPYLSEQGELLGLIGIAHDLTEHMQRQEHAERLRQRSVRAGAIVAAQESERQRIARELHDGLGQILTSIRLGLEILERQASASPRRRAAQMKKIKTQLSAATAESRRLASNLMPQVLQDFGIAPALQQLCRQMSEVSGVHIHFFNANMRRTNGDITIRLAGNLFRFRTGLPGFTIVQERFDTNLELVLYRIAQEALNNVVRHAQAKQATVLFARTAQTLRLMIQDNGRGIAKEKARSREEGETGRGLMNMRERAEALAGSVQIESAPGEGTTVVVELPLAPNVAVTLRQD